MSSDRVTKSEVVRIATLQSQRAQTITRSLRAHAYKTTWDKEQKREVPRDPAERVSWAQAALNAAREIERDAAATRSWVEAWAQTEGAS